MQWLAATTILAFGMPDVADDLLEQARKAVAHYDSTMANSFGEFETAYERRDLKLKEPQILREKWFIEGKNLRMDQVFPADDPRTNFFWTFNGTVGTQVTIYKTMPVSVQIMANPTDQFYSSTTPLTASGTWHLSNTPRKLSDSLRGDRLKAWRVQKLNGRDCLEVDIEVYAKTEKQPQIIHRYALDPDHAFLPYSIDFNVGGKPTHTLKTVEYRRFADPKLPEGRWFPVKCESPRSDGGKNTLTVIHVSFNQRIDPETFAYRIPDGSDVFDMVKGTSYRTGGPKAVNPAVVKAAKEEADKKREELRQATPNAPSAVPVTSIWPMAGGISIAGVALLGLLWWWRR